MKKFKAMLAATAAVMALSAVSVPMSAFAEDVPVPHPEEQKYTFDGGANPNETWDASYTDQLKQPNPSANVNVSVTSNPTYMVTIPADVAFKGDANEEVTRTVNVDNVFLEFGKFVKVSVQSANEYRMMPAASTAAPENWIEYTLKSDQNERTAAGSDSYQVIKVASGNKQEMSTGVAELKFNRPGNLKLAGKYSDILTFTIKVEEANENDIETYKPKNNDSGNNQEP